MINLMAEIKAIVPSYVRISRVLRDIPPQYIVGGLKESVRSTVKEVMTANGTACRCIRCREYGHRLKAGWKPGEPRLSRLDYEASEGHEIFLSFEDENETLFGLLRLRIEPEPIQPPGAASPLAFVRELHVYGGELPLGKREEQAAQHHGLGKALLAEAERIASEEFGTSVLAILSGVGARQYYADQGYRLESGYMIKDLPQKSGR
jgi:elongator complex protein 3